MYLAPWASSAFLIAASSVFQRSSWKFDHDTPTVRSFAIAAKETTLADASKTAPIAKFFNDFIDFLPYDPRTRRRRAKARAPPAEAGQFPQAAQWSAPPRLSMRQMGYGFNVVDGASVSPRSGGFRGDRNALAAPALDMTMIVLRGAHRPFEKAGGRTMKRLLGVSIALCAASAVGAALGASWDE